MSNENTQQTKKPETTVTQKEEMTGGNFFWRVMFAALKSVSQNRRKKH